MTEYKMTLSTTEPNNYVGLIKLRQGDVASQSIQATITANGQLFKFDGLSVFFNAVLPNGNVIRDKVTEVDYVNSKLNYVVADSFLQEVAQVTAWFSFENGNKTIDSTKNFQYSVIGGWKKCIPQGNYIYELSEIQREIEEIISNKDFTSLISKMNAIYNNALDDHVEIAKARASYHTLPDRLTNFEALIGSKADGSTVTNMLQNILDGSPKGTYANISALMQAKPTGDKGIYITLDNKNWNYWNGSDWVAGGIYQSSAVSPIDTFAFVSGRTPVNFNNSSKTIEVTGTNTLFVNGKVYTIVKESIPYITETSWIVLDTTTSRLQFTTSATASQVVVGALFTNAGGNPTITFNGLHSIDGLMPVNANDVPTFSGNIIYSPNGNIIYDKVNKTLKYDMVTVKIGKTSYNLDPSEATLGGNAGFIVFDKIKLKIVTGDVSNSNQALLGYYDNRNGNVQLNTFQIAKKIKKIACIGDSITEGHQANGWPWHAYINQWCKNNGIETTVVNLGIGGTSVCTSSYVTDELQPFVNRLDTIPTDADVVVVFGGTNDWGNNATLGTISDTDTSTFYGAYKHILEWLAINRPNAKVMTMTPLKRYYKGGGTVWKNAQIEPNNKGDVLGDFVAAVREVSALYAIPCVDLHNDSGLNPVLEIVRTKFMGDGLHPNAEGNKKMYPIILDKMCPLLEYD